MFIRVTFLKKNWYNHANLGSKISIKLNKYFKKPINISVENQKSNKNPNVVETRLYMEKKKKETSEKQKLDILKKKRLAEERKTRLDKLQKTTKELIKATIKKKVFKILL